MGKEEEPAVGIPYAYPASVLAGQQPNLYHVGHNPYQAGMIPPNAIYGDPKDIPLVQTMYRDTPAPFQCVYCANSGLTNVKSKLSLAAVVGCMMPLCWDGAFFAPPWIAFGISTIIARTVDKRLLILRKLIHALLWILPSGPNIVLHFLPDYFVNAGWVAFHLKRSLGLHYCVVKTLVKSF